MKWQHYSCHGCGDCCRDFSVQLRVDDLDKLEGRLQVHGLPRDAFEWYLDLRKFGSVPHAGFGMGIERVVAWLCGLKHVREAIPFPRTLQRIYP